MGQVLHGSATTTEVRAIQHSHVWPAPADQGFVFGDGIIAGAVMSPACCCGLVTAGPDWYPLILWPDQESEREAPTMLQAFRIYSRLFPSRHHRFRSWP